MFRQSPHDLPRADLRARAEAMLEDAPPALEPALADALKLVHELQVHEVELQLQQDEIERSQAELSAALTRQLWLFDQAPVGWCSLDADGVVTGANLMAGALLRCPCDSLPGIRLEACFTAEGAQAVAALLCHVAAWPLPHAADAALPGDPPVVLEVLARADPAGHGTVVALLDASARRQAEDQRRRADGAERVNQARAIFMSEMNHELRTPLGAVIGLSELMLRSPDPLTERQRRMLTQIEQSGRHMLAVASDALDLARIDAGHIDLALEAMDLEPVLTEVLAMVAGSAAARSVALDLRPMAASPALADGRRLRQVLLNLLSNAIKYNREGGSVTVAVEPQPGALAVQVRDTGQGLSEAQLQLAFHPFQRLGAERSKVDGTGLGLALSRRLAEAMGGSLSLSSTVGAGTTALLLLRSAG